MNRKLEVEWLKSSYSDLVLINEIIENNYLAHIVAFHSQKTLEKTLKALIKSNDKIAPKKHDLLLLKESVAGFIQIDKEDILEDLKEFYIESRYSGDMGLLPNCKPTPEDAREFYEFAQTIFEKVCEILAIDKSEIMAW